MLILRFLTTLILFTIQGLIPVQAQSEWSSKTLIVIIPSNQKKIAAWNAALQKDSTNLRLQRNLLRETRETEQFAAELEAAFVNHFDYADILFLHDSALQRFTGKNYLIAHHPHGQEQEIAKDAAWYVVRRSVQSGAHGFVLCDQTLQQIPRPFPSFYRLNRFGSFVQAFFNGGEHSWRPLSNLVQKINDRLYRYDNKHSDS